MIKSTLKGLSLIVALISFSTLAFAQSTNMRQDLSMFPKPEEGYKQMVIDVPHSENDDKKKIEFSVGKMMEVDGCNTFFLAGELEQKDLDGWGYNYYVFKTDGTVGGTRMGCPDMPNRHLFVSAQPEMVRYNGRMPIVIYVPTDYDVQFKIYKAEDDVYRASEVRHK